MKLRVLFVLLVVQFGWCWPSHAEVLMSVNFDEPSGEAFDSVAGRVFNPVNFSGVVGRSTDVPLESGGNLSLELDATAGEPGVGGMFSQAETLGSKTNAFTMEGWIKPARAADMTLFQTWTAGSRFYAIIGVGKTSDNQLIEPVFILHSNVVGEDTTVDISFRADPLPVDSWIHLALAFGDEQVDCYVNGRLVHSEKAMISIPERLDQAHFGAGGLGNITGKIDDLRWSDEKLAPEQLGSGKSLSVQ